MITQDLIDKYNSNFSNPEWRDKNLATITKVAGEAREAATKKFELIDVWYLEPATLTEARKWLSKRDLADLEVGHSITYQGMGHPVRFTVRRIR